MPLPARSYGGCGVEAVPSGHAGPAKAASSCAAGGALVRSRWQFRGTGPSALGAAGTALPRAGAGPSQAVASAALWAVPISCAASRAQTVRHAVPRAEAETSPSPLPLLVRRPRDYHAGRELFKGRA